MVSPSWSKVHLTKKDVAMIVTKTMTTVLTVVRFHLIAGRGDARRS
jgi:hypothetical protein